MYNDHQLSRIYDRTSGYCHICRKKLAFTNYGRPRSRGAWEIEHSVPRVNGGTDHGNNLYAACIPCNRTKGSGSTRSARNANGRTRSPLSRKARIEKRQGNKIVGGGTGALIGSAFGPVGTIVGGIFGLLLGSSIDID